jgi:hypothetical protein
MYRSVDETGPGSSVGLFSGNGARGRARAAQTVCIASPLDVTPYRTAIFAFDAETGDSLKTKMAETSATVGDYVQTEGESA